MANMERQDNVAPQADAENPWDIVAQMANKPVAEVQEEFSGDIEAAKEQLTIALAERSIAEDASREIVYDLLERIPTEERLESIEGTTVDSYAAFMKRIPKANLETCEWSVYSAAIEEMRNPDNWEPSRHELHTSMIEDTMIGMQALSDRLRAAEQERGEPKPIIYLMRGCCGAGKTTALRSGERIAGVLDENGKPTGTLAPDTFKGALRRCSMSEDDPPLLTHSQVHQESGFISAEVNARVSALAEESRDSGGFSMVVDKLMGNYSDVARMFETAEQTDRNVSMIDVDVPLELSAIRVLGRTAEGDDPQMNFDKVAMAFRAIRTERHKLLKEAISSDSRFHSYELVVFDKETRSQKTIFKTADGAERSTGNKSMTSAELAQYSMSPESAQSEIDSTREQVITPAFIERFINDYFAEDETSQKYADSTRRLLVQFMGMTIGDAMSVRCGEKRREDVEVHSLNSVAGEAVAA